MLQVLNAARKVALRVFYALHRRYRPGDYEAWKYIAPTQKAAWSHKTFEHGTWGGEIRREFEPQPGDIVAREHWCSSGFANTDLDLQLKKHGIHKLIVMGLIAHTCVEATVRFAAEFGYEVTVIKDAIASFSDEEMHAALDINIPNYASAIVTTKQVVDCRRFFGTAAMTIAATEFIMPDSLHAQSGKRNRQLHSRSSPGRKHILRPAEADRRRPPECWLCEAGPADGHCVILCTAGPTTFTALSMSPRCWHRRATG